MNEPKSLKGTLQTISRTAGLRLKENDNWFNPVNGEAVNSVKDDYRGRPVEIFLQNGSNNYLNVVCLEEDVVLSPASTITPQQRNLRAELPAEYIQKLNGKEFITHQGLLWMAHLKGVQEIKSELQQTLGPEVSLKNTVVVFKATITMKDGSVFQAYGDATDDNVNSQIKPHKIRMAETRALNRALRLATNLGMTSLEELGGSE